MHRHVTLYGGAQLIHIINRGSTLGLGASHSHAVLVLALLLTLAVLLLSRRVLAHPRHGWKWGLLIGGAVGNDIGRVFFGRVTDFLKLPVYPGVMNIADIAVRLGVLMLVLALFAERPGHTPREAGSR